MDEGQTNKRDLDLEMKHSDQYDSYADENGDGTLEGAVYGLFAKEDIIHPDGHYVKQDSGNGYFVYVKVPLDSTDIISVDRNDEGFVKSAILKKFTVSCGTSYPNALPAQDGYAKTYTEAKSYWLYDGVMQHSRTTGHWQLSVPG